MYGCYYGILAYGFIEELDGYMVDSEFIEDYPEVKIFAIEVVKNYMCRPVYGIDCYVEEETGEIIVDTELIDKFYNDYVEFLKKEHPNENIPKLGYHLCVKGDFEDDNETYTF